MQDIDVVIRNVSLNTSHTQLIGPRIAAVVPPDKTELMQRHSRFRAKTGLEEVKGEYPLHLPMEQWQYFNLILIV